MISLYNRPTSPTNSFFFIGGEQDAREYEIDNKKHKDTKKKEGPSREDVERTGGEHDLREFPDEDAGERQGKAS
jgi:hypothetical protein